MRLLIDMNLTPRWVQYLGDAGLDCQHWSEIGPITASDASICAYAHTVQARPSIVLLRGEPLTPEIRGAILLRAIRECEKELAAGAILTIDWSDRVRARLLPLKA